MPIVMGHDHNEGVGAMRHPGRHFLGTGHQDGVRFREAFRLGESRAGIDHGHVPAQFLGHAHKRPGVVSGSENHEWHGRRDDLTKHLRILGR